MALNPVSLLRAIVPQSLAPKRAPAEELEKALDKWCEPPSENDSRRQTKISAIAFKNIRSLLSHYDDSVKQKEWAIRPRIFTVLRNIRRLDTMPDFIACKLMDGMLPFNEHELPPSLGQSRRSFVNQQAYCLTDAAELEKGSSGKHVQFNYDGDLHFFKMSELGSGGYGHVDRVWSRLSNRQFARKKFLRSWGAQQTQQRYDWFEREIGALKKLSHRHLVKIKGTYTDINCFAFLMEPVAECNLQQYLNKMQQEQAGNLRTFFGCLANAVTYLHDAKVYHMDIKLVNIVVKGHQVYLTDFGAAHDWSQRDRSTTWASSPRTVRYMPPEQATDPNAAKNYCIDIWSLGVVFLEMTTILRGAKLKDSNVYFTTHGSRHPHVYGNPVATNTWLEQLRSRDGPDYDNLPLIFGVRYWKRTDSVGHVVLCQNIWGGPFPSLAVGEETSDDESVAEFFEAEETNVIIEEDDTPSLQPRKRTTIQSWIERTEATGMRQYFEASNTGELPFDVEDDSSDPGGQGPAILEEHQDPIPTRFSSIAFFIDSNDTVGDHKDTPDVQDPELAFDVESDESDSHTSDCPILPANDAQEQELLTIKTQIDLIENGADLALDVASSVGELQTIEEVAEIIDTLKMLDETTSPTAKVPEVHDLMQGSTVSIGKPESRRNINEISGAQCHRVSAMEAGDLALDFMEELTNESPTHVQDSSSRAEASKLCSLGKYDNSSIQLQTGCELVVEGHNDRLIDLSGTIEHPHDDLTAEALAKVATESAADTAPLTTKNLHQLQSGKIRKKRGMRLKSRVVAKKYMQQVCVRETEAATTVMSQRTSAELRGLTLSVWASNSAPILENYVSRGNVAAVRALLKAGCNPGTKRKPKHGPLMAAVKGASLRHNKCADALLKAGANVNIKTARTGRTVLSLAVEHQYFHGYRGLIWTLLHWGANPNIKDRNGDYPLLQILYGGYAPLEEHKRQALALILEQSTHPTDVNVEPPGTLNMPLHLAVRRKDPWAVGMLLEKGAKHDVQNGAGQTPFALAISTWSPNMTRDHKEVSKLLLARGADPDETYGANQSPALHSAIQNNHADLVELLIRYSADPLKTDNKGQNANVLCNTKLEQGTLSIELADEIKSLLEIPKHYYWDSDTSGSASDSSGNENYVEVGS